MNLLITCFLKFKNKLITSFSILSLSNKSETFSLKIMNFKSSFKMWFLLKCAPTSDVYLVYASNRRILLKC